MIIVDAKIKINKSKVIGDSLKSGTCCTMIIDGNNHICQMESYDGMNIPLETLVNLKVSILSGELSIESFQTEREFELFQGSKVGTGIIERIMEVYVEKQFLESITDVNRIKEIVTYAEKLYNAIVFDDVYKLI